MSRIQESINDADIRTRVLFNRATAQLGLCAFRLGETRQALNALQELFQSNRVKELIAQGITPTKWNERDVEKEKTERQRQYQYHMHINLDILESAHLISAMLSEVPNIAIHGIDNKRRIMSKHFRRFYDYYLRQAFNGPPENTRDKVMAATRAMQQGDWQKCLQHITGLRMWKLLPNSEVVQSIIKKKIQEESLKTYLLTYGAQYSSIAMAQLVKMFELPEPSIYTIASKMMVNEQLHGSWDQPSRTVIMHTTEPSKLQKSAIKYTEKVSLLVEQHERLLLDQRHVWYNKPTENKAGSAWPDYKRSSKFSRGFRSSNTRNFRT